MDLNKIKNADLNDIVFEGRNKVYGAYFLRRVYDKHVLRGFIISLVTFVLCLGGPVIWEKIKPTKVAEKQKVDLVDLANIKPPPPVDRTAPPPPPPPPPPPLKATIKFTPPVIKKDEEVHEDPPKQEEIQKVAISTKTQEGSNDAPEDIGVQQGNATEIEKPTIFTFAEIMPSYPGGEEKMYEFIQDNLKYPTRAKDNQTEGRVMVQFVVLENGSIGEVKTVNKKRLGDGCEESAMEVIRKMKSWNPGKQNGKAVQVWYTVPIQFSLQ
ncbi:MAG: hypothetical protein RL065_2049 [Bacteroidota bacterium]